MHSPKNAPVPRAEFRIVGAREAQVAELRALYRLGDNVSLSTVANDEASTSALLSCVIHRKIDVIAFHRKMYVASTKGTSAAMFFRQSDEIVPFGEAKFSDSMVLYDALMNRSLSKVDLDLAVLRLIDLHRLVPAPNQRKSPLLGSEADLACFHEFIIDVLKDVARIGGVLPQTLDRMWQADVPELTEVIRSVKNIPADTAAQIDMENNYCPIDGHKAHA